MSEISAKQRTPQRIAVIPGDGIGVDVTVEASKVLAAAAERWALPLETVAFPWSADHYLESGETLPDGALQSFEFTGDLGTFSLGDGEQHDVDLPDPKLHKDECREDGSPRFSTKRYTGPLFIDSADPTDVKQGHIGDCYLPSAAAALARPGDVGVGSGFARYQALFGEAGPPERMAHSWPRAGAGGSRTLRSMAASAAAPRA